MRKIIVSFLLFCFAFTANAQVNDRSWQKFVYEMPDEFYASDEAIAIAENVLLYQFEIGGWQKNTPMQLPLTEEEKQEIIAKKPTNRGATTDNGATIMEMDFLAKIYQHTHDERYREAFVRGLDYLIEAQYPNGGWPQYYPLRKGYYSHITYNDDSMVRIMALLKNIAEEAKHYDIIVEFETAQKAREAFERGIECVLKTQIVQDGILTGWCAQHDEHTLAPAKARAYELPSLSGKEGANIVLLLMDIENPSPEVINAVRSAVAWFDKVRIQGIRVETFRDEDGKRDRRVIEDPDASDIWARFYTLEDNRPMFVGRDGIIRFSLAEIEQERRGAYGWYTTDPREIFEKYPAWEERINQ